tara:strand:+ start:40 stop:168 length:129 start_codon:yes stop_codon:yes gene_type:complete
MTRETHTALLLANIGIVVALILLITNRTKDRTQAKKKQSLER